MSFGDGLAFGIIGTAVTYFIGWFIYAIGFDSGQRKGLSEGNNTGFERGTAKQEEADDEWWEQEAVNRGKAEYFINDSGEKDWRWNP